jgi:hypothetical protein
MKKSITPITLLALILFVCSCARKAMFTKSVVVPSASGQVKVKKDNNSNYSIRVSVRDLTVPENLVPPRNTYVVWSQTKKGKLINLGKINTSRSMLARGYKASLSAVSPARPQRIFITAEDRATVESPGTSVILTTEDF